MALETKTIGRNTFFELHVSCPVCHEREIFTSRSFWSHHNCGGTLFLGDNAYYLCNKCNKQSHVKDWKYGCPTHSSTDEIEFISSSSAGVAAVLCTAGMMVNEAGLTWLQTFLRNMGEF